MIVWSSRARAVFAALTFVAIALIYGAPLLVIVLASVAGQWNGVWPSAPTLDHFRDALQGDSLEQLRVSLVTAFGASLIALLIGASAALALRDVSARLGAVMNAFFFLPSAMPSVSIGLGLLVAFSRTPLLLNGTIAIVFIAHVTMIAAFAFGNVAAGLARLPPDVENVAESLGANPTYRLLHVTLPMIRPQLAAAFGLGFALSMGELGATMMVYPPGWTTLPVGVFSLSDRGEVFDGAALTMLLIAATLAVLWGVGRVSRAAA